MGEVKKLLDSLLQSLYSNSRRSLLSYSSRRQILQRLGLHELNEIEASLRRRIIVIGTILAEDLIRRDRYRRSQELLCGYVDAALHFLADNSHPPMRFSLIPPPAKSPHIVTSPTNKNNNNSSDARGYSTAKQNPNNKTSTVRINLNNNMQAKPMNSDQRAATLNSSKSAAEVSNGRAAVTSSEIQDDYNQWLHAMKLVARLPGGMPPEFRRKLWLTLAEKYLKSRNVDWEKEEKKCLSEEWREDDEELGIQIVKDLHRTGSNLCSGPAAKVNQARLKRVLLGYARYNPEVGYCQGFNMLGALILQVMDKEEVESMKVMIYLVEGILPPGYFCGSMGGLQADMGVFRDLMQCKLPRLAKHLEKLQGPVENAYEPPLTNVFTMQWFLTMFCTCLPMTCVLRVWDLVLIEGSDVLLRTALVLWSLLEERVLGTRSADDFYCKMGSFASELLNGHLIDSNSLIEKVVQLGPIADIEKLRNKHLYNITPIRHKSNLPLYLGDEEPENDEDSRLAIATVWGIPWTRRGSQATSNLKQVPIPESKDRLALDISLLKKQYDKLRERQKQAHIIITTACSTARQGPPSNVSPSVMPVNQLLMGRSAIVTNQGRRVAPLTGAIPPARKPSLPTILQSKPAEKQLRRGETLHWRDTDLTKRRRDSLTWKEIKADRLNPSKAEGQDSQKIHSRIGKSDSSSYSEESEEENGSSTDTSLCDDDPTSTGDKTHSSSIENSPKRRLKVPRRNKGSESKLLTSKKLLTETNKERTRPKSWAPSTSEIPFMLLTSDSPTQSPAKSFNLSTCNDDIQEEDDGPAECSRQTIRKINNSEWAVPSYCYSPIAGDLATTKLEPLNIQTDIIELPIITSISQLSPMPDITSFLKDSSISPLPTPKPSLLDSTNSLGSGDGDGTKKFDVSDDGVTNQYFERVNSVERPTKLDLYYSLNEEDGIQRSSDVEGKDVDIPFIKQDNQQPDLLIDHPRNLMTSNKDNDSEVGLEKNDISQLPMEDRLALIGERDNNIPGENLDDFREPAYSETIAPQQETLKPQSKSTNSYLSRASQKRRDPRRLTLTRSTTMEIEERFQALEKHFNHEIPAQSKQSRQEKALSCELNYDTLPDQHFADADRRSSFKNSKQEVIRTPIEDEIVAISSKPEIPSTTDLEERFERQMSASDKRDKNSIELRQSSTTNESDDGGGANEGGNKNREEKNNDVKKRVETEIDSQKATKSPEGDESTKTKTTPKRMPSTAELEERFDALEIRMKVEKNSPTKNKKEPPDIQTETKSPIAEASVSRDRRNDTVSQDERKEPDQKSKQDGSKTNEELEVESSKRKTPPSTAELEKRFHALEKQMSTSAVTSTEQRPQSESDSTEPKSTDKSRQFPETEKNDDQPNQNAHALDEDSAKSKEVSETDLESDTAQEVLRGKTSGRRASEPPSTEDLERRYESLKRRMSTRIFSDKSSGHAETIDEALQRIERNIICEDNDGEANISQSTKESNKQREMGNEIEKHKETRTIDSSPKVTSPVKTNSKLTTSNKAPQTTDKPQNSKSEEHPRDRQVPEAPPLPAHNYLERSLPNVAVSKERQALIEELQSKMEMNSDEATLKPSSINPNRKPPPPLTPPKPLEQASSRKSDETLETHALTAFLRSENYEPWHGYAPKAVRRFSDLPSRADLENRLEFLEQKFFRKLLKQRCASDSEVASRKRFMEEPSSSVNANASTKLEQRLQALEKQLSENSLKLLEAMRARAQDIPIDSESPRRLSTETIDAKGMELVRYTHVGELEESGVLKPINISINIKMTVDKNAEGTQPGERAKITTGDLERRLEALELQLKTSQMSRSGISESEQLPSSANSAQTRQTVEASNIVQEEKIDDPPRIDSKKQILLEQEEKGLPKSEKLPASKNEVKESQKTDLKTQVVVEQRDEPSKTESKLKEESIATTEREVNEVHRNDMQQSAIQTKKTCSKCSPSDKEESISKKDGLKDLQEKDSKQKNQTKQEETQSAGRISKSEPNKKESTTKKKDTEEKTEKISDKKCQKQEDTKREAVNPISSKAVKDPKTSEIIAQPSSVPEPQIVEEKSSRTETSQVEKSTSEKSEDPTNPDTATSTDKLVINASEIGSVDANKKTLVLLLDNEPKAVKVRRLTRANTEELEGLFQALEKQLQDRNLVKADDGTLKHANDMNQNESNESASQAQAISELTKEIEEFTSGECKESNKPSTEEEKPYDWGPDPIKRHLKRKTVHLPSTKELEARFRSLERQIKLLEDVEKIDVEQRLHEIERKIKLQYSLAHEKDLTKYLELCEGKGLDDEVPCTPSSKTEEARCECGRRTPSKTSPGCTPTKRKNSQSPSRKETTPCTSPAPSSSKEKEKDRASKESPAFKSKTADQKKQPIHPLEMLLDPSPDDNKIPTTGELEHRIRVLDEQRRSPTPTSSKSRSKSPVKSSLKTRTPSEERRSRKPLHKYPTYDVTPTKPEPPTAEELEARMRALEENHVFDPKTQKNFKEFNEKLKNVMSPSVSFEECKIESIREISPRRNADPYRSPTSRFALRSSDVDALPARSTSPKVLRFSEDDDYTRSSRSSYREPVDHRRPVGTSHRVLNTIEENSKILHRILKKTIAEPKDDRSSMYGATLASFATEGLDALGSRLMRETSPLRRTGTVTGVPLRTDDNINERLSSIKDTIKSIDSLCEEKPYSKEKCQRYIDSLFSDSVHFAQKKTSLEELRSRSASRTRYSEYTPSIHVSDLSQRPSEYYLSRSIGSAESIRTTSPLRAASPLHYRSNRDLTRNTDVSPARRGRRYDEEREEYESRVRRDYMLPNLFLDNHSNVRSSGSSLTKFYKVDSQLEPYERDKSRSRTPSRSPMRSSPYELRDTMTLHNNNTTTNTSTSYTAPSTQSKHFDLDKPVSPYRQTAHSILASDYAKRLNTPVYNPSKLEIRHTTVTSTFYDRLLTEKQLEKSLSRPPSRSPVQATPPTVVGGYLETAPKAANTSNDSFFKVSSNYSSSTLTAQTGLHYNTINISTSTSNSNITNTNTCTTTTTTMATAAITGSILLTTSTITTSTTSMMSTMPSMNSTLSYLNNITTSNQTTSAASSSSAYTISEPATMGLTNNRSYTNLLLSSSNLAATSVGSTSNFSSFLPSTSDKASTAFTSFTNTTATTSTGITIPFTIANSSISTLGSYTSTVSTGASYPLMSASFQPSSALGSHSLGPYSSSLSKNFTNIGTESYTSSSAPK